VLYNLLNIIFAILQKASAATPIGDKPTFPQTPATGLPQPTPGENWVVELITKTINWLLYLAGALAVLAIVYSGIMYITSAGNEEQTAKAKKNLIWAIIAVIIISLALLIPQWVINALNTGTP